MMTTTWLSNPAPTAPAMHWAKPTTAAILGLRTRAPRQAAELGLGDEYWHRALQTAGLGQLMDSAAVKLVLVPSDRAFIDLLHELRLSWAALCADLPRLRSLLLGHVVTDAGDIPLCDLHGAGGLLRTANQSVLRLRGDGRLQDAQGRHAALLGPLPDKQGNHGGSKSASQLIDRVLRPPEQGLLELLAGSAEHSDFLAALRQTGHSSWLAGGGPFTVLAPSNAGWAEQVAHLGLSDQDRCVDPDAALASLVSRHLLAGRWLSDELPWGGSLVSLSGDALRLTPLGLIGDGPCSQSLLGGSDRLARNGVMHRLAKPLTPHAHH